MKRLFSAVLAFVLMFALSVTGVAASTSFSDIKDTGLTRDVAVLQMLGAVSGDGSGSFMPDGSLTRAAFCKMAVIVMGKGDQETLYRARTIFPDVRSGYWARGYINYAVSSDKKFIVGNSDGSFRPDDPVTYAQAVAMVMRILGYSDADAGMLWPDGYLSLASDKGVTDGLAMTSPDAAMTRAQAAHLFCNLLGADVKAGGKYIATLGTATADAVIMQLDVAADDGTGGAVRTSEGVLKTTTGILPASILGLRGTLLKDSQGKLLTFLPDKNRQLTVTASTVDAAWLKDVTGVRYNIKSTVAAYTPTEKKTYGSAFVDIASGMAVTLFYAPDGEVNGVYINSSKYGDAVVLGLAGSSSLGALTGGDTGYKIYKNGALASSSDLLPYDVATYDSSAKILYVTDFRLTGSYENCWPSVGSPAKVTVLGHEFNVLPSAIESLASCSIGQGITLLLTSDLQVAGAVTSGVVRTTAIGIVQPDITTTSASVKLLNGLVLSGTPTLGEPPSQLAGELVIVNSSEPGMISLTKLNGNNIPGDLDLTKATLGGTALSPAVRIFERVGKGAVAQITLSDLTQPRVAASKVLYASTDYAGRVDTLILNDVTGDRYVYGFLRTGSDGNDNGTVSVVNSDNKSGTAAAFTNIPVSYGTLGGVAFSGDGENAVAIAQLTAVKDVKRSSFYVRNDDTYVSVNGTEFPVASNVQCYNSQGKSWFKSLDDARAYSDMMTVYYDRPAAEGGKIRIIVAG